MIHSKYSIPASTLIEIIISMVIFMIVIGISMQILINVGAFHGNNQKCNAHYLIENSYQTMMYNQTLPNDYSDKGIQIEHSLTHKKNNIYLLHIKAFNKQDAYLLLEKKEYILYEK